MHSTLWMSFSLASLVLFIQLESGGVSQLDLRPFWAGACESIAVYSADHLRDMSKAAASMDGGKLGSSSALPRRRAAMLRALLAASLAGFTLNVAAMRSWRVVAVFCVHVALCITYAKLKPRMPYLKAVFVSLCVVYMAVAAPAAYAPAVLQALGPAALSRLLLLVFCISFTIENLQDVRDIREDRKAGVVTIPSGLGSSRSAHVLLAVQAAGLAFHCGLTWTAALPLRLDLILVHVCCSLCTACFREETPRSLFQLVLEPLYVAPLAAAAARAAALGS